MTKNAFILNFFKLYNMLWVLLFPFLKKNKRLKPGFHKQTTAFHHTKADIWIQAASAGEAYLAVDILKRLSPASSAKVLVTATTSQGIRILKTRLTPNAISQHIRLKIEWFPFDCPSTIEAAAKIINPGIMVLLETEIWPALLYYLKQNHTKIFIINARLSRKSYFLYLKTRFLWKHLAPDMVLATSRQDAKRYQHVFETARVKTMPNIKFESIETGVPDSVTEKQIKTILSKPLPLTILASVRKQEEKDILHILKKILTDFPDQVVAIFPRHMHRITAWEKQLAGQNLSFHLRSQIKSPLTGPGIILWDTFGELTTAYGFARVAFVGGSLKPLGGQNFIEPAAQGAVTLTGPYYDDFSWAGDDIFTKGIVIKKSHWRPIAETIIKALKDPGNKSHRISLAQEYITSNKGGTHQACHEILKAFDEFK